jgi:hypothetical protein
MMAGRKRIPEVTMQGVKIVLKNFSGVAKQYNAKGLRNFLVLLDEETAQAMKADGWNVKYLKPREEGEAPSPFLKVNVNFENEPIPKVVLVTSRGQTVLDEETVGMLDGAYLTNVDLSVTPYQFDENSLISAYLRKGYFTMEEDELDLKYGAVSDASAPGVSMDTPY